jgi:glycosyltransferase involved in cell wall biosynthesis
MRIAQLVSNYHKVGPHEKRAIYSSVAWLCNGLSAKGHNVDLFGAENSEAEATIHSVKLRALTDLPLTDEQRQYYLHLLLSECFSRAQNYDIIHSHFSLLSSFYARLTTLPVVQSIHSPVSESMQPLLKRFKSNNYISFSLAQRQQMPDLNWVANIYHGVDTTIFKYNDKPSDYLLYLGRITEDKGVHFAIAAAKAAKQKLVIAGSSYPEEKYWQKEIEPHIDGVNIRYVGNADFYTKIEYLQQATALMFPTQYHEVFGLSMIEAMACGTPVIGWNSGSVAEVIEDGVTGYVVKSVTGMTKAIKQVQKLPRQASRDRVQRFFSVEKMVSGYEKVYARIIERHKRKHANGQS